MAFKIIDWAGNVLNIKGRFERPEFAVPMEFNSIEDAKDFVSDSCESDEEYESQLDDLEIVKL